MEEFQTRHNSTFNYRSKMHCSIGCGKGSSLAEEFLYLFTIVTSISNPIDIFYDNSGALTHAKDPIAHHQSKHIIKKYHLI